MQLNEAAALLNKLNKFFIYPAALFAKQMHEALGRVEWEGVFRKILELIPMFLATGARSHQRHFLHSHGAEATFRSAVFGLTNSGQIVLHCFSNCPSVHS